MRPRLNLLVIEDAPADFLLVERRLRQDNLDVQCLRVDTREELASALETGGWDVVLFDYNVPGLDFSEVLVRLREHDPDLPLILVSGTVGEDTAVDLLRQGVWDFVLKDRLARLTPAIERALADVRTRRDQRAAEELKQQDREQQAALRAMLESTLSPGTLEDTLTQCLKKLLSLSWLSLLPQGGVFLMADDGQHLRLAVAHNLEQETHTLCARVPLGHCHCGRAAASRQMQYAAHVDAQHDNTYSGMADHGHYNLPLLSNGRVLGVLVLYLLPGMQRDAAKELFLASVADILAGYICRKHHEERLRFSSAVMENSHEGMLLTDLDSRILAINPAFTRITGYSEAEVLGKTPELLRSQHHDADFYRKLWLSIKQTGLWQGEIWNRRKSGEIYPQWLTISVVYDEDDMVSNYVGVFSDISKVKNVEERLTHLAHYDVLTDLPNRLLLQTLLKHALERAQRHRHGLAVLFIDLDRFKHVNDSLGHSAGDELLRITAARMVARVRDSDTVARLGGDEFVLLLEKIDSPNDAASLAEDVIELLTVPIPLASGQEVYVGASIGISIFPDDGTTADQLIRNADAAMYQAKEDGRNTFRFYTEDLTRRAQQRLRMESSLRQALNNDEFILHYQPLVGTERCKGVEALLRWDDPKNGLVAPMEFIPLAEDTRMIIPLGEWVLRTACTQMKVWMEAGLPLGTLAVNLSPVQFRQPDIAQRIAGILAETGLPAAHLELEITESTIMEQGQEAEAKLAALHSLGIRLAIDDFGTGYSSLAYLKRFPIHTLKIDQSFVRDIPGNPAAMEIAATIIAMAKNLSLEVLAEGVETAAQFDFLKSRGCDTFQGYLFSRPEPADVIPDALAQGLKQRIDPTLN